MRRAIRSAAVSPTIKGERGEVVRRYLFDENSPVFSGHFPGYPIVPAVVQILLARELIEESYGYPMKLKSVESAKFHKQLRPGYEICVSCRPKEGHQLVFQGRLEVGDEIAASFALSMAREGDAP